jgi:hypothetical protein
MTVSTHELKRNPPPTPPKVRGAKIPQRRDHFNSLAFICFIIIIFLIFENYSVLNLIYLPSPREGQGVGS